MGSRVDPPWYEAGWRETAESWTRSALAHLERPLAGGIEEVRTWSLSCVLRAPTDDGWVYFKEALDLPLFADEPRVTQRLAELYPGVAPKVLATDPDRGWMLTADAGAIVGWEAPEAEWTTLYEQWAQTQRRSARHVDGLLAMGCVDRDIRPIPQQFDAVLNDTETMSLLTPAAAAGLARVRPILSDVCEALASVGIPDTLVHGDLHVGNMAVQAGRCVVIDWTDVSISHPFMDALVPHRMADAAAKERTREAILSAWEGVAPAGRLREAWELSEIVCPAHHVVSYGSIMAHIPVAKRHELVDAFENVANQLVAASATRC
jgi:hypothetical protein